MGSRYRPPQNPFGQAIGLLLHHLSRQLAKRFNSCAGFITLPDGASLYQDSLQSYGKDLEHQLCAA